MDLPLPDVDDSKLIIFLKIVIIIATITMLILTSVFQTINVLSIKKRKIGFVRENK